MSALADVEGVAGLMPADGTDAQCDVCDCPPFLLCADRGIVVCSHCIRPGRLGGLDHWMPGCATVCAHRRVDALAIKMGAEASVLYEVAP